MAKEEPKIELLSRSRRKRIREPVLTETLLGVLAVICVMIAVLLLFSMVHAGGAGGEVLFNGIVSLIGVYAYFSPLLCLYIAYYLWKEEVPEMRALTLLGGFFLIIGIAGLGTLLFGEKFGGFLGTSLAKPLVTYFAFFPSVFFLGGISMIGAIIFLERKPSLRPLQVLASYPFEKIVAFIINRKAKSFDDEDLIEKSPSEENKDSTEEEIIPITEEMSPEDNLHSQLFGELSPPDERDQSRIKKEVIAKPIILTPEFVPPPLDLLNIDTGKSGAGDSKSKMITIQPALWRAIAIG
jgi:hypothetical protein